jgi:hypothetical protein
LRFAVPKVGTPVVLPKSELGMAKKGDGAAAALVVALDEIVW